MSGPEKGPAGDDHPDEFVSNDQSADRTGDLVRESNPNAASEHGLEGDMGVSSERTEFDGVEDTGSVGTSTGTDGTNPTTGGPEFDPSNEDENPADLAPHETDLTKNPGHSHG